MPVWIWSKTGKKCVAPGVERRARAAPLNTVKGKEMKNNLQKSSMYRKVRRIHFVGIGGIGMSGIAEVLLNLGYEISGSDLSPSDITQRLDDLGAAIHEGHDDAHIGDADVVVTSTAVRSDNPEVLAAHRRNIPVIPRAEMLAELLKMKFSIAVSGSHGKTTTTSMVSTLLAHGGLDPTMVIGGKLASIGGSARLGDGEVIVAEADESDGSFLKLSPCLAVITNIDREHLDYYRNMEELKEAFLQFANIVPFYGSTILCLDDPHVREILPRIKRRAITYGISEPADYRAERISFAGKSSRFSLTWRESLLGTARLNVPGLFNIYNALAAIAVAREMGLTFPVIREGLQRFTGVQRRLEVRGEAHGIIVVDDYGHHPTEIRATLAAARQVWPGRIIVVFQPHRYTRTQALFDEFLTAFTNADHLIVTDIYAASEDPIPGVTAEALCEAIRRAGHPDAVHLSGFEAIAEHLAKLARPSDVILTQGAGSVWKAGEAFLKRSKEAQTNGRG
jgi:UDP-N-acetylmuramate--alanine ligase